MSPIFNCACFHFNIFKADIIAAQSASQPKSNQAVFSFKGHINISLQWDSLWSKFNLTVNLIYYVHKHGQFVSSYASFLLGPLGVGLANPSWIGQ